MTLEFNQEAKHTINRFSRLGTWYILALSVIVSIAIIGQLLIQNHVEDQLSDSHVINVAGRQRMLSQRITKCALLLKPVQEEVARISIANELDSALRLWASSHTGLQFGDANLNLPGNNSPEVKLMFGTINSHHEAVKKNASFLVEKLNQDPLIDYDVLSPAIETILAHQDDFLDGMNKIVFQYDVEARAKVMTLSKLEYILLGVSIVVILLEIFFVFRPTTFQVNQTVNQLIASEKNAKKLSKEIGALYASLEKSYVELSNVNVPIETPKIYAKTDRGGNVIFVSDLFTDLSGVKWNEQSIPLVQLFHQSNLPAEWMDELIELLAEGNSWQGTIQYTTAKGGKRWAELMVVPTMPTDDEEKEWLVLGSDITRQKQAEGSMRDKNRAEIEKKINQQKFRSVLILEGQEEERKRLAMDIHDGIGQMLTSLKFQIESIDLLKSKEGATQKLVEIQDLITQVIKEVRRVTFNLKPTVLGDFGLQAGLNVFVREISKLTDIELTYTVESSENIRLPQKVENNIFRIIQEAINNAIKYSKASRIEISYKQTETELTITVQDNGEGFDEELVESRNMNIESGRGFFNMYERTEYVNGHLDIRSSLNEGTRVTLHVPVKTAVTI